MSRSIRQPYATDGYGSKRRKYVKNQANRVVRKYDEELPNGKKYKLLYNSWNIRDFSFDMVPTKKNCSK